MNLGRPFLHVTLQGLLLLCVFPTVNIKVDYIGAVACQYGQYLGGELKGKRTVNHIDH